VLATATLSFVVVAVAIGATALVVGWLTGEAVVPSSAAIPVMHQLYEYTQTAELICAGGQAVETGGFDTMTIEVWADFEGRRFRQHATFPDGSTHDVIALGHPSLPSSSFARGESKLNQVSCPDEGEGSSANLLLFDPTQSIGVLLFNSPEVEPGAMGFAELGTLVAGVGADSRGRPAALYRATVEGFSGDGSGDDHSVEQLTDWYVDPATGEVLEITFRQTTDGIADVSHTTTLIVEDTIEVDESQFDIAGYALVWEESDYSEGLGVEAQPVEPSTRLGPDWIWPETPDPASPIELASRFATEVLGWARANVTPDPAAAVDGPQLLTIDDGAGRSLQFLTFPIGVDGWGANQIGEGGLGLGVGAEAKVKAIISPVEGAATADILVGSADDTLAWRVELAPDITDITLPGITMDEVRTMLVIFSDESGQVISAAGGQFSP